MSSLDGVPIGELVAQLEGHDPVAVRQPGPPGQEAPEHVEAEVAHVTYAWILEKLEKDRVPHVISANQARNLLRNWILEKLEKDGVPEVADIWSFEVAHATSSAQARNYLRNWLLEKLEKEGACQAMVVGTWREYLKRVRAQCQEPGQEPRQEPGQEPRQEPAQDSAPATKKQKSC